MKQAILTPRAAALERIKALVLDTLPSPESKRAYGQALDDFFRWCEIEAVNEFSKATVNAYRTALEQRRLSSSTISQRLSAIRKSGVMPRPFHLIHQPAVASAGFHRDWRARRQARQELAIKLALVHDSLRLADVPFFVDSDEHRELLVRIASNKMIHLAAAPPFQGFARSLRETSLQRFHSIIIGSVGLAAPPRGDARTAATFRETHFPSADQVSQLTQSPSDASSFGSDAYWLVVDLRPTVRPTGARYHRFNPASASPEHQKPRTLLRGSASQIAV
jgi:hypothetical protein